MTTSPGMQGWFSVGNQYNLPYGQDKGENKGGHLNKCRSHLKNIQHSLKPLSTRKSKKRLLQSDEKHLGRVCGSLLEGEVLNVFP